MLPVLLVCEVLSLLENRIEPRALYILGKAIQLPIVACQLETVKQMLTIPVKLHYCKLCDATSLFCSSPHGMYGIFVQGIHSLSPPRLPGPDLSADKGHTGSIKAATKSGPRSFHYSPCIIYTVTSVYQACGKHTEKRN